MYISYTLANVPQLNLNLTPEFAADLERYMRRERITSKSEALRRAIRDAIARGRKGTKATDFRGWLGLALKSPPNPKARFKNEDDLWS